MLRTPKHVHTVLIQYVCKLHTHKDHVCFGRDRRPPGLKMVAPFPVPVLCLACLSCLFNISFRQMAHGLQMEEIARFKRKKAVAQLAKKKWGSVTNPALDLESSQPCSWPKRISVFIFNFIWCLCCVVLLSLLCKYAVILTEQLRAGIHEESGHSISIVLIPFSPGINTVQLTSDFIKPCTNPNVRWAVFKI